MKTNSAMTRGAFRLLLALTSVILTATSLLIPAISYANGVMLAGYGGAVDAMFRKWQGSGVPGCTVGIREAGAGTLYRSYGTANLAFDVANSTATVFEAGSVSKQFTAAAVMLLVAEGKLTLDDDIRRYLPELPDYGTPITVGDLLSHTSGLRDWESIEEMAGWPVTTRVYTNADVLAIASRQKSLNFKPGTSFSYSNTGYNLLALIVRRVTGQSLAQFSHDRIFAPLGMDHTQWRDDFRRVVKGQAVAYEQDNGSYEESMPFEDDYGNGGLLTTVPDLLRWNDALATDKLGKVVTDGLEKRARLSDGREISYARGLYVLTYNGHREISHSGATAAYRAWLARYPQKGLSVAMLCNAGDANVVELGHSIAGLFLPAQPVTSPKGIRVPEKTLEARAGLYMSVPLGLPLRLQAAGGSLQMAHAPELVPVSDTKFVSDFETLEFSGRDAVTVSDTEGHTIKYQRASPWHPDSRTLANYQGTYTSGEIMASYRVSLSANGLVAVAVAHPEAAFPLMPLTRNTFTPTGSTHPVVEFKVDATGQVTALEMRDLRVYGVLFQRSGEH